LITDVTAAGQVFNALASYTGTHEFDLSLRPQPIDAIIHLAAIPRILITPDNEVFRINVMGTYNIMDAATKLGIKKIIFASSETIYGLTFANEHRNPAYFPLDEEYPINPMDSYALSKAVNERTGMAFHERSGFDIYGIRIGNVIEPHEYELFPQWFKKPDYRRRIAWSYIDARDLGQICRLAIEKDGLGFQIFNAASADTSSDLPTAQLVKNYYNDTPLKRKMGEYETLLANDKVVQILGFHQEHFWRNHVKL
jgi:nucleoside-diphosphate-sugar epimerase